MKAKRSALAPLLADAIRKSGKTERQLAQEARAALAEPQTPLEAAALGQNSPLPETAQTLDDLRLAVLLKKKLTVREEILKDDLTRSWALALPTA